MEKGLISVDRWKEGSQAYFLTHLHSDHTQGLTSSWAKGPIFCSRLTAKLFPFRFPNFRLSLLRVLDLGTWYSLFLLSPSSASPAHVQVMGIDACHCPGAVMFLFRGEFGCLLYTGDFRWERDSERANKARAMLFDVLSNNVVDIVYLDNTYCNPSYVFPSREVAAQQVVEIIASHPDHDIIIGIDSLGKEELLLHISHALGIKIWLWPERLQTMHLLGFHSIFTTNASVTRVRAVPRYSFSLDTLDRLNETCPTIGIMPSGLPWAKHVGEDELSASLLATRYYRSQLDADGSTRMDQQNCKSGSVQRLHKNMFSVPYSDHSCFKEIEAFIKLVQPISVKGIVSSSSCYTEPLYYFGRLCGLRQAPAVALPPRRSHHKERKSAKSSKKLLEHLGVRLSRGAVVRLRQRGVKVAADSLQVCS